MIKMINYADLYPDIDIQDIYIQDVYQLLSALVEQLFIEYFPFL